jgi:glycosyltransferase involved in cell wall biosynthesis
MTDTLRIVALFGARVNFGQERANVDALAALREQGAEVLCIIRNERWPELVELNCRLEARGLKVTTAPYIDIPRRGWIVKTMVRNPIAFVWSNFSLMWLLFRFKPTHIHTFNPLYTFNFILALSLSSLPVIYRAGDRPVLHNFFWRLIWRFIVNRTAHFVADTEYIKSELAKTGVPRQRISVIYAPPPARSNAPSVQLPSAVAGDHVVRFVYAGQVQPHKGVDLLLDAFSRVSTTFPQARLVVAGPITDWSGHAWARQLQRKAEQSPSLACAVAFMGFVEDIPRLMSKCHVHFCPTVSEEPYGLVVLEAKSVGIPSVVFPSGGLKELVRSGIDGIVTTEKTSAALVAAMTSYLTNPACAAEHGRAAHDSLRAFGFETFADRWAAIYAHAT